MPPEPSDEPEVFFEREDIGLTGRFWAWYELRMPTIWSVILPLVLIPAPAALSYVVLPEAAPKIWGVGLLAIVAIDGALGVGFAADLTWWVVLGCVMWTETLVLLWLLRNLDLLRAWPRFDRFIRKREAKAIRAYRKRQWMRKSHVLGVAIFVFLPLSSGIFAGALVGKFTGLSNPRTFVAVMAGTFVWAALLSVAFYFSIDFVQEWVDAVTP